MSLLSQYKVHTSIQKKGQIQVIFGPMFSGKTTELIRRLKRYQIAKYRCLIIKYTNDDRYGNCGITTHDQQELFAVNAIHLEGLREKAMDHDVIGIDEGQFFTDIVSFCEEMANKTKIVIVAALDGTFQRAGFHNVLNLVPLAENVVKLHAVCMICCQDASYTKRIGKETQLEVIGGAEKYMAVCRECYLLSPLKCKEKDSASVDIICSPVRKMLFNGDNKIDVA